MTQVYASSDLMWLTSRRNLLDSVGTQHDCRPSVVSPQNGRSSLQLIITRQMRPTVGPIDVDGHMRWMSSCQTWATHWHTSRHDVERVGQWCREKLDGMNWNNPLLSKCIDIYLVASIYYPSDGFDCRLVARIAQHIGTNSKADWGGQYQSQNFTDKSWNDTLEKSRHATFLVDFFRRRKHSTKVNIV